MPICHRITPLIPGGCPPGILCGIRRNFFRLSPCDRQVAYVLLTRAPVAGRWSQSSTPAAPRLACVKPVASVHPEPGSNSSLLYLVFLFFFSKKAKTFFKIIALAMPSTFRSRVRLGRSIESPGRIDRDLFPCRSPGKSFSCTTSSIFYCNNFNVLAFRRFLRKALQSYNQFLN